jgi:hypothetical protein
MLIEVAPTPVAISKCPYPNRLAPDRPLPPVPQHRMCYIVLTALRDLKALTVKAITGDTGDRNMLANR